jgi:hypothetical protein
MIDKKCSKLMDTKCNHDYKNHHRWERNGIVHIISTSAIWQCLQCGKCVCEELTFIE